MEDEANLMHWKGTLKGPKGTPYEGGVFKIDIQLPADYPFVPPKVGGRAPCTACQFWARRGTRRAHAQAPHSRCLSVRVRWAALPGGV